MQGGDEKVGEIRLGLLGFRREIEGLNAKVDERRKEVEDLVAQRKGFRRQMQLGRKLLDVDYRLCELEQGLMITSDGLSQNLKADDLDGEMGESEEDSDEDQEGHGSTLRLDRHVRHYLLTRRIMDRAPPHHPFILKQEARMTRVKDTLLLDLGNALKQSSRQDEAHVTDLLAAYRDLGESHEALKILQERKA